MQAYHLEEFGKPEGIVLRNHDEPKPGPNDVVTRVRAASLNRRDLMILGKTYPLPAKPDVVPLSDGAGEVVAVGDKVSRFKVGDRVTGSYWPRWHDGRLAADYMDQLGCTVDGMAAEFAVFNEQWLVRLPDYMTWEEGASLSCAGVTAWCSVMASGSLKPGQTVLTLGTGDVSLFAVQFAKMMGCRVIATTSQDAKAEKLKTLGADHVINYVETPQWGAAVRELTGGLGADLVVETMGPETIEQSLIASASYSEIVVLIWKSATQSALVLPASAYGPKLTTIRRLFVGSRVDLEAMIKAMSAREIRPVVDRAFPFAQAHEAYRYYEGRSGFGKVVLLGE
ncbi:zinc-dependent alcohol dehydrogenase family protein [Paraburkholderia megapolitana]|uniref:zinc-dependent alcohol dehydrogenase family protein n=1 Tax=Paraburkholderia megapolitana TaxID=420953 RepID=UPI0038BC2A49